MAGALATNPLWLFGFQFFDPLDIAAAARIDGADTVLSLDRNEDQIKFVDSEVEKDAKSAWKYFQMWNAGSQTIIPGTAYISDGKLLGYPLVTMWDVGSFVLAYCSAYLLGLITDSDLNNKTAQIISLLHHHTMTYGGSKLPQIEISSTIFPSKRSGFDASDVSRLLIALKILDNLTLGKSKISTLVSTWDFSPVIKNRMVSSVKDGKIEPSHETSYTGYTARGYQLWGYGAKFETRQNSSMSREQKIAFIKSLALKGRIATEPNTNEVIELGETETLRLTLDILLAAQIKRFKSLGALTCVSEGILDQEPWFTYQACQLDLSGEDQWVVDTVNSETSVVARRKGDVLRAISTKGCFMWHAVRPGAYSSALLHCARTKANTGKIGFASGIYETNLKAMTCSDINTNAAILESLAYLHFDRQPLLTVSQLIRDKATKRN